mgnify:CR=1 FL=1|tara:strand:- start:228 stop:809 length:582 start_codon:yes stop_codon:yes gene_type:complete
MVFVVIVIALPIAMYLYQFGFGLWSSHADWGIMGSYFGGVLGPIITSISLAFLAIQIRAQTKQRSEEAALHVCFECELDITSYIPKVKEFIQRGENSERIKQVLFERKRRVEEGDLEGAISAVKAYVNENFAAIGMWVQIDASLRTMQRLKMNKFKRMRTLLFSEIDIEHLVLLDSIREGMTAEGGPTCLFPD